MKTTAIRIIQQTLTSEELKPGAVDGQLGITTYGAVTQALTKRQTTLPADWPGWSDSRKTIAYLQCLCKERKIEVGGIDGKWGPQTEFAVDTLTQLLQTGAMPPPWRDDTPPPAANPNNWPLQNETALNAYYGAVGTNQVNLPLPYPLRVSWDLQQTIKSFQCNAKVRDSASRVLTKVFDHYGIEQIKELRLDRWGGCLNVRQMRGGSSWSMHSWGIAIDFDPDRNQLKWGRDRAVFAQPAYDAWWRFWEEEGWTSLGRVKNYDWMHVQATRL
jgi:hypothetical protein